MWLFALHFMYSHFWNCTEFNLKLVWVDDFYVIIIWISDVILVYWFSRWFIFWMVINKKIVNFASLFFFLCLLVDFMVTFVCLNGILNIIYTIFCASGLGESFLGRGEMESLFKSYNILLSFDELMLKSVKVAKRFCFQYILDAISKYCKRETKHTRSCECILFY